MLGPRAIAAWALRTKAGDVRAEGVDNVPATGAVLLVARHYHHLLDGALLIRYVPRPVHIVVGLDWTSGARARRVMETACALADYPVVLRRGEPGERLRAARSGLRAAVRLLRDGRVVAVFPEGWPNVDPAGSPKDADGWLPFAPGFVRMLRMAQRAGVPVAVVPVGFVYARDGRRWTAIARFGPALRTGVSDPELRVAAESAVRRLCAGMMDAS